MKALSSITSGEILWEDYMKPLGLTQNALARALDVPPRRINEIVLNRRKITLDTSLRLGRFFGQSPLFWLNIQTQCDYRQAKALEKKISKTVIPLQIA
ncbi:MAG: HigA family addiction module antidote protein [Verrucomicrobiae bacterium]|nr:HigA family addiction module antidote protein [Verrucomicrobiae bacterium]